MKAAVERALSEHDVHAGQEFVLQCLWREDGLTPGELARRIGVETPTITRAVQRMEAAGLVRRRDDPLDARLVRVHLTDRGRELQKVIPKSLRRVVETALAGFSEQDRATLERLLALVRSNLAPEGHE